MLRIHPCRSPIPTLKQPDVLPAHFMQLSGLWCKLLIIVHVLSWIPAWYIRRNRCECITLSNAAFASRSTRCQFCFSSVNILYASSTGRAAFMRGDPFVNPLCVGFCILWINGCILSLIIAYKHLSSGIDWNFRWLLWTTWNAKCIQCAGYEYYFNAILINIYLFLYAIGHFKILVMTPLFFFL